MCVYFDCSWMTINIGKIRAQFTSRFFWVQTNDQVQISLAIRIYFCLIPCSLRIMSHQGLHWLRVLSDLRDFTKLLLTSAQFYIYVCEIYCIRCVLILFHSIVRDSFDLVAANTSWIIAPQYQYQLRIQLYKKLSFKNMLVLCCFMGYFLPL